MSSFLPHQSYRILLWRATCAYWTLLLLLMQSSSYCQGCTVFLVGKDATVDGSVLVSHSNDGEFVTDPRLVSIPAMDDTTDDDEPRRPVFFSPEDYPRYVGTARGPIPEYYPKTPDQEEFEPIGYIPLKNNPDDDNDDDLLLPATTFTYLEETYGALNEQQLGMGESTCSGVFGSIPLGAPNGTALLSIDELTHIAMERTSTARQAIQLMGRLAERHGFYGAGQFEGTAESLGVTDPQEAWIFHILPDPTGTSAIWAAQRVPDDGFAVLANMFVIRQVDPADTENFMMSASVHSVAVDYGWWDPDNGELLDFTKIYSDGEYAHKYYSGRRMWGAYHLAAPSQHFAQDYVDLQSDPVYPVWIRPDFKLSAQDLFRFHRYTYQGTRYDLGAAGNMAAGPFGSPDRWKAPEGEQAAVQGNWERPIGLYRTSDSFVVQSRQDSSLGGVLWFGPASALGTVFTPFLTGMEIPASFRSGHHAVFSRESAFWAACFVHNVANLKWSYAIHDVEKLQKELEQASTGMVQRMEAYYSQHSDDFATVEQAFLQNAASVVAALWSLSDTIVFKYASGFVNEPPDGMSQQVGYPAWWLREVGYQDGPPPPPTQPKCCHPPPNNNSLSSSLSSSKSMDTNVGADGSATAAAHVAARHNLPLTGKAAMKQYLQTVKMAATS